MNTLIGVLFLTPIIAWGITYFINPELAISWTDKFSVWVERKRKVFAGKRNFTSRFFFNPLFFVLSKLMSWTETRFKSKRSRGAARVILSSFIFLLFILAVIWPLFLSIYLAMVLTVLFPLAALIVFLFYLAKKRSEHKQRVVVEVVEYNKTGEARRK